MKCVKQVTPEVSAGPAIGKEVKAKYRICMAASADTKGGQCIWPLVAAESSNSNPMRPKNDLTEHNYFLGAVYFTSGIALLRIL